MCDLMVAELTAAPGGQIAGIIGEVGISAQSLRDSSTPGLISDEERSLMASARAQQATGAAISIHFDAQAKDEEVVMHTLSVLHGEGVALDRVVIGHLSLLNLADTAYHLRLIKRGAYVEYDFQAYERDYTQDFRLDDDAHIASQFIRWLIDNGGIDHILVSPDIGTADHFDAPYYGYRFIFRRFGPAMLAAAPPNLITEDELYYILSQNPQRLLPYQQPTNPNACASPYVP